jgi:hypothetical protein
MRLCRGYAVCKNAATVWHHGPYCGRCAERAFGRVPIEMAKLVLETARREVALPTRPGNRFSSVAVPSLRGRGSTLASVGASDPAPVLPSLEELEALLAVDTLSGPGWVEA